MNVDLLSFACYPFICIWKNIYSGLLPEFWIGWVFGYWFVWDAAVFWIFILCHIYLQTVFFSFFRLSFNFATYFLLYENASKFNLVLSVYFCFYFFCLRRDIKNIAVIYVKEYSLLRVLYFHVWQIFNLFWVYFLYSMWKCSNLILLHAAVWFSQQQLLKRLSFFHCCLRFSCHSLIDHRCVSLFLGSWICSIGLCVCFCANPYWFTYCSFVVQSKV